MKRRIELDWVRAVSMLGVVMIHASAPFIFRDSRFMLLGVTPALFCNQATRVAVPLFFLLSGLGLGLGGKPVKLPGFWLKRLWRVGVPYLLWSLFYFLLDRRFQLGLLMEGRTLRELGWLLLLGGAASHLWFIPALLQLYILYPLLRRLMDRQPVVTLSAGLALTLFATLIIVVPLPLTGWWRPHLWRMFPIWIFYFLLGMALTGERLERLSSISRARAPLLIALGIAAALVYVWDAARSGNLDAIKIPLFLYTPIAFAALVAAWKYLERPAWAEKAVLFLAEGSMTVYFSHVFFLRYLRRIPLLTENALGMLGLFVADALLSLALAAFWLWGKRLLRHARRKETGTPQHPD